MPSTADIDAFHRGAAKVELHVHLVGAASAATALELARRHPVAGVPTDDEALRACDAFTDFAHFIEVEITVNSLVRTAEDVAALVVGVAADVAAHQVRSPSSR